MKPLWFSTSLARRFRPYVQRVNYKQRWFGNPDQMTREPTREVIRILKIQTSSQVLQLIKLPTSCCAYRSHLPAKKILDLKNQVQYMLKQFKITKWILKIDTLCLFYYYYWMNISWSYMKIFAYKSIQKSCCIWKSQCPYKFGEMSYFRDQYEISYAWQIA